MNCSDESSRLLRTEHLKLAILALLTIALAAGLLLKVNGLNGPEYWRWPWRHLATLRVFAAMFLASLPVFAALAIVQRFGERARPAIVLPLLMLGMLAMQLAGAGVQHEPFALRDGIARVIVSPSNTSYFYDAVRAADIPLGQFLRDYPHLMPQFTMHAQEKPPGPMLFFAAVVKVCGPSPEDQTAIFRTATIAGLLIGVLATLNVPAVYALARTLGADRTAAFLSAAAMCLMPGLLLHFPMLDQLYPIISCALLITWVRAVEKASFTWAAGFGVVLAVATFVVYHFLVLGAFLAMYSLWFIPRDPRKNLLLLARLALVALAACALVDALLFATAGFDVITTFKTALHMQGQHLSELHRPYPWTILHDLQDFALGFGWLAGALAVFAAVDWREDARRERILAMLCLAQPIVVACSGLMQTETARTWCFMLPLIALPAGLELARWRPAARWAAILMMWLIFCLVVQHLTFIFHPSTGQSMFSL
jgi:hypothetical protein